MRLSKAGTVAAHAAMQLGDTEARHDLWMQGSRMASKLVSKFTSLGFIPEQLHEEAWNEAMLAVGEHLEEWDPRRGAYSTFIWACVRNALIDYGRAEAKHDVTIPLVEDSYDDDDEEEEMFWDQHAWHPVFPEAQLIDYIDLERSLEREELQMIEHFLYQDVTLDHMGNSYGLSASGMKYRLDSIFHGIRKRWA